jgi:hypothetical protein
MVPGSCNMPAHSGGRTTVMGRPIWKNKNTDSRCYTYVSVLTGPADLDTDAIIPNEQHPSDHLPVWADFEIAPRLQVARDCAQVCLLRYVCSGIAFYTYLNRNLPSSLTKCIETRHMHALKLTGA